LVKLDRLSGWTLVSKTAIVMYFFSFVFYLFNSYFKDDGKQYEIFVKSLMKSKMFFTGLLGLIFFNLFLYVDNKSNPPTKINNVSQEPIT
jgi:hypothetical protein